MLFRLFSCACAAVGLSLGSYNNTHTFFAPQPASTRWLLQSLDGKALPASWSAVRPLLVLSSSATATRNSYYRGAFRQSAGAQLRAIPDVINTLMRHSDQALAVELRYLTVLDQTTHYEVRGANLHLYAAGRATPLATFARSRNPAL